MEQEKRTEPDNDAEVADAAIKVEEEIAATHAHQPPGGTIAGRAPAIELIEKHSASPGADLDRELAEQRKDP